MLGDTVHNQFVRLEALAKPTEDGGMTQLVDNAIRYYHFLPEPAKSVMRRDYEKEQQRWC